MTTAGGTGWPEPGLPARGRAQATSAVEEQVPGNAGSSIASRFITTPGSGVSGRYMRDESSWPYGQARRPPGQPAAPALAEGARTELASAERVPAQSWEADLSHAQPWLVVKGSSGVGWPEVTQDAVLSLLGRRRSGGDLVARALSPPVRAESLRYEGGVGWPYDGPRPDAAHETSVESGGLDAQPSARPEVRGLTGRHAANQGVVSRETGMADPARRLEMGSGQPPSGAHRRRQPSPTGWSDTEAAGPEPVSAQSGARSSEWPRLSEGSLGWPSGGWAGGPAGADSTAHHAVEGLSEGAEEVQPQQVRQAGGHHPAEVRGVGWPDTVGWPNPVRLPPEVGRPSEIGWSSEVESPTRGRSAFPGQLAGRGGVADRGRSAFPGQLAGRGGVAARGRLAGRGSAVAGPGSGVAELGTAAAGCGGAGPGCGVAGPGCSGARDRGAGHGSSARRSGSPSFSSSGARAQVRGRAGGWRGSGPERGPADSCCPAIPRSAQSYDRERVLRGAGRRVGK